MDWNVPVGNDTYHRAGKFHSERASHNRILIIKLGEPSVEIPRAYHKQFGKSRHKIVAATERKRCQVNVEPSVKIIFRCQINLNLNVILLNFKINFSWILRPILLNFKTNFVEFKD